jgi:hypothetical protein
VFGRKKTQQQPGALHEDRPGAKNRPTPKRRDQEAARVRPLVPTDRKVARNQDRESRRAAVALQRQAMLTGDERHMPARDAGPVRRYIRDYVDARRSAGEFLLPVMLVFLAFSFVKVAAVFFFVTIGIYALMLISIVDAVLMWRRLKRTLVATFGADQIPRGAAMYAGMRAFQLRPLRMPKPQVTRGGKPR